MSMDTDTDWLTPYVRQLIQHKEDEARHCEGRANACEADALEYRRLAELARKSAEYLRKSHEPTLSTVNRITTDRPVD